MVWHLLTNWETTSFEAVAELIDCYRARWEIETFFPVLKNGCRVEALQRASISKLERALAVYRGSGDWLVGYVRPNLDARSLLTKEECQAAYILAKKSIPKDPPTLREVIRQIAMLGGFLGLQGRWRSRRENPLAGIGSHQGFRPGV
jgi:hypothetical protein